MMKEFEEENKYKIDYSNKEHKHDKELLNSYIPNGKVNNLNKENESIKRESIVNEKEEDKSEIEKKEITEEESKKKVIIENESVQIKDNIKYKEEGDLTKVDYRKCSKGHPLTSIDLGLLDDSISI